MTKLGLARPELSKSLRDRHALDAALQKCVELRRSSREALDVLAALKNCHASLEPLALDLLRDLVALVRLSFRDALDVEHLLLCADTEVSQ